MAGRFRKFILQITKSYRLSVNDKNNFTEVYSARVSKLKLGLIVFLIFAVSGALVVVLFFYTPLKQVVPGYPSNQFRQLMLYNSVMIDSLEQELTMRDNYLEQIRSLIKGEVVEVALQPEEEYDEVLMAPMTDDSIFNKLIGPDKYKFTYYSDDEDFSQLVRLNFFPPLKGLVINKFKASSRHMGADIVGVEGSYISSVLKGTVIFAEWSVSTGYVVHIQHSNNLVSVYKHNSEILVRAGDQVEAGDLIAIMGDAGELSTGPHLHFELWQNGVPLNPEQYISFK